ncbi:MAG: patatin-like phospholipase family protein [Pseudomonadales bacterium]|nr:patatin-like phospholipase family protein [Pseudomonadales bacterium]
MNSDLPKLGIALGSGSARGWAHIGVLQQLREMKIEPDVVVGCSMGAMVGASYVANNLDELEQWATELTWRDVFGLLDVHLSGGLFEGRKLFEFIQSHMGSLTFADLQKPFAAVATDIETGREIWLRDGPIATAIRASASLPGVLTPYQTAKGRYLLDGGLVNPVPISLCKAMGADIVIAVNLNAEIVGKHLRNPRKLGLWTDEFIKDETVDDDTQEQSEWLVKLSQVFGFEDQVTDDNNPPGMLEVVASAINIMQDRVTRSRMAGDPADLLLSPKLAHLGLMEFNRASEAIEMGRQVVRDAESQLHGLLA